jgi:hypothetical protein
MAWPWKAVERDDELQNPTSPEKVRLLGDDVSCIGPAGRSATDSTRAEQ